MDNSKKSFYSNFVKRILDFLFSLILIILLSPVFLIVTILVKEKLGRPVLFKQRRPGLNEKIFTMYKFRTMTDERDEKGELLPDSIRLTKFGKILRSTSLDELPELLNILKGDMSFVGPRPLSVKYLPYYNEVEKKRHRVKPGLTGLAQVNGRNKASWETRFAYDIEYISNISLMFDIRIIVKTIIVVFKRKDVTVRGTGQIENFHEYRMKKNKESGLKNGNW
ncbi:sugar transferase [Gracilibacillus alcaliphilus]|uniref:sugar transferase n=1 Tax=Gracilibacillus alcaliphilus TaxID=1401441 RepID=UPI00195E2729|nr:sugar transferase [Gracilibacillus alcaliphilus]MBM7678445.1 lipopolysaccharide/colanic/teichoic acid biosynthesis glycosyltransferase [Gracilibacillus alcaliphilus]